MFEPGSATIKHGFKVLRSREDFTLISCAAPKAAQIIYPLDVWMGRVSGNGPLAIFKSVDYAQKFLYELSVWNAFRIHHCDYVISAQRGLWYMEDEIQGRLCTFPAGTFFADGICVRELYDSTKGGVND